jgi:predicted Rossmann fold nucleotide-binding protein DprA/Smf involved in DNA uptake
MNYLGNKNILEQFKTAFLCSRRYPAGIVLKAYDWAQEQRDKGHCIISGFHSTIEKDVFNMLLKGGQPLILVLARGLPKRLPQPMQNAVEVERLLMISPFPERFIRPTAASCESRNELIFDLADEIVIAYASVNGSLARLISSRDSDRKTIRIMS